MHARREPGNPLLYSVSGFQYCELLLASSELAAWRLNLKVETHNSELKKAADACRAVTERARRTLDLAEKAKFGFIHTALDLLTLGRAALYIAIFDEPGSEDPKLRIEDAIDGLGRAGLQDYIPRGLLTRAWLRFIGSEIDDAQADLDEAWEIAERGPMRLHMADIHLYRARLFHKVEPYLWNKFDDGSEGRGPKDDLDAAEELINKCGYHRRDEELADAKLAILDKT
jgi:hypothetical protein